MSNVLLLEAASLFLGDADPTKSKHLSLTSLTLPTLEYQTVDHNPGGGSGQISFSMNSINKIEPTFKIAGFDPEGFRLFAIGSGQVNNVTAYGVIRDKREGRALQGKAVFRGSIGKLTPDAFTRGNEFGHDYSMIEVSHYELWVGGVEWWTWDFWTQPRPRVFGVEDREYMAMLGLV
jgi:uncharacterized protein